SVLIAITCASFASNFAIPDWYAFSSLVQPPVNAATKKASTTVFLPRNSDSFTGLLSVSGRVKSGATSPTLRVVLGGLKPGGWAERAAARVIPASSAEIDFIVFSYWNWDSGGKLNMILAPIGRRAASADSFGATPARPYPSISRQQTTKRYPVNKRSFRA